MTLRVLSMAGNEGKKEHWKNEAFSDSHSLLPQSSELRNFFRLKQPDQSVPLSVSFSVDGPVVFRRTIIQFAVLVVAPVTPFVIVRNAFH